MNREMKRESKDIIVSATVPLLGRVSIVKKKILEWEGSLETPVDHSTDEIRLSKYEQKGDDCVYRYVIARDVKSMKRNL